jgi:hypothetical protein
LFYLDSSFEVQPVWKSKEACSELIRLEENPDVKGNEKAGGSDTREREKATNTRPPHTPIKEYATTVFAPSVYFDQLSIKARL